MRFEDTDRAALLSTRSTRILPGGAAALRAISAAAKSSRFELALHKFRAR